MQFSRPIFYDTTDDCRDRIQTLEGEELREDAIGIIGISTQI